jgi:hypothetical protein
MSWNLFRLGRFLYEVTHLKAARVKAIFIVTTIEPSAQVVRDTFDGFVHYASDTSETKAAARKGGAISGV